MFNIRLKEVRVSLGLTQQFVADLIGATLRHYQKYESGETSPPISKLKDIAIALNISTDYLLGLSNSRTGIFENATPVGE